MLLIIIIIIDTTEINTGGCEIRYILPLGNAGMTKAKSKKSSGKKRFSRTATQDKH
jgi:hypothetical protein